MASPLLSAVSTRKDLRTQDSFNNFKKFLIDANESIQNCFDSKVNISISSTVKQPQIFGDTRSCVVNEPKNSSLILLFQYYCKPRLIYSKTTIPLTTEYLQMSISFVDAEKMLNDLNVVPKLISRDDLKMVWRSISLARTSNSNLSATSQIAVLTPSDTLNFQDFQELIIRMALKIFIDSDLMKIVTATTHKFVNAEDAIAYLCNYMNLNDEYVIRNHIIKKSEELMTITIPVFDDDKKYDLKPFKARKKNVYGSLSSISLITGKLPTDNQTKTSMPKTVTLFEKKNQAKIQRLPETIKEAVIKADDEINAFSRQIDLVDSNYEENVVPIVKFDNTNQYFMNDLSLSKADVPGVDSSTSLLSMSSIGSSPKMSVFFPKIEKIANKFIHDFDDYSSEDEEFPYTKWNSSGSKDLNRGEYDPKYRLLLKKYSFSVINKIKSDIVASDGPFLSLGQVKPDTTFIVKLTVTNSCSDLINFDIVTRNFQCLESRIKIKTFPGSIIPGLSRDVFLYMTIESSLQSIIGYVDVHILKLRSNTTDILCCPIYYNIIKPGEDLLVGKTINLNSSSDDVVSIPTICNVQNLPTLLKLYCNIVTENTFTSAMFDKSNRNSRKNATFGKVPVFRKTLSAG